MTEHSQTQKRGMQQGPAMSVRQAWEDFKGETTAHGLSKLKLENSRPKRIVWMVVLMCTLSVLSYHLSNVVREYLANEVNVDLKIVSNKKSDFPAVTICNANAVRASSSGVLNNILNKDEKSRKRRSINSLIFDINKKRKPILKESHKGSHVDENVEKQISRFGVNNKPHNVDSKNLRPTQNVNSKGSGMSQKESNSRLKYDQSYKSHIRHKRSPGGGSCMNNTDCNNSTCTTSVCECDRLWHGSEFCADKATLCESTRSWNSSSAALTSTEVYVKSGHEYVNTALVCSPGYILQSGQLSIHCEDELWHTYNITCSAAMATTPASQSLSVVVNTIDTTTGTTAAHTAPSWRRGDPPMTELFEKAEAITYGMAQFNDSVKQALGYQIEDMLFDCEYDGHYCSIHDFVQFYNPFLGNCFTFNSHWKNASIRSADYTGRRYGLQLSINVDQDEYGESTAPNLAGVLVLLHNRHKMPFPEDEGVMLMTGQFALIGIRKVKIKRQPSPYSDCIQNHDPFSRDVYEELYNVQYDKSGCLKTCRQKYIIKTCRCASAYYPKSGIAFGGEGNIVDVCNISNNDTSDCLYAANIHFNNANFDCNCPSACKEEEFHPTISKVAWPTAVNEDETMSQLKSACPHLYKTSQNRESDVVVTRNNFIRLSVYFKDLRYEQITEVPIYTWPKFLADLGSCIGLWMGFSILTIIEFVEFGGACTDHDDKGKVYPWKKDTNE